MSAFGGKLAGLPDFFPLDAHAGQNADLFDRGDRSAELLVLHRALADFFGLRDQVFAEPATARFPTTERRIGRAHPTDNAVRRGRLSEVITKITVESLESSRSPENRSDKVRVFHMLPNVSQERTANQPHPTSSGIELQMQSHPRASNIVRPFTTGPGTTARLSEYRCSLVAGLRALTVSSQT